LENRREISVFNAVVLQLGVENDLRVKKALVQLLGRIDAQAAIPVLRELLNDPSESVASSAAEALTAIAPSLNPQARKDLFDTVRQTLVDRTGPPGQPTPDASADLRAALVVAGSKTRSRTHRRQGPFIRSRISPCQPASGPW